MKAKSLLFTTLFFFIAVMIFPYDGVRPVIAASSFLPTEGEYAYGPDLAFDGDVSTAWNEAVSAAGIGEYIEVRLSDQVEFNEIVVMGGYFDSRWFKSNNRVKKLRVTADDREYTFEFRDQMTAQQFRFPAAITSDVVRFTIADVYPGDKWNDTPIAEIELRRNGLTIDIYARLKEDGGAVGYATPVQGLREEVIERGNLAPLQVPLVVSQLFGLSKEDLRVVRNTIPASHGYRFSSMELQEYFLKFDWYQPGDDNSAIKYTEIEQRNIELIRSLENDFDHYSPELVIDAIARADFEALAGFSEYMTFDFVYKYRIGENPQTPIVHALQKRWGASQDSAEQARALVEFFLTNGGSINRGAPLVHAAVFRHWPAAELLLDSGADLSYAGYFKTTGYFDGKRGIEGYYSPYDAAVKEGHMDIVHGFENRTAGTEMAGSPDMSGSQEDFPLAGRKLGMATGSGYDTFHYLLPDGTAVVEFTSWEHGNSYDFGTWRSEDVKGYGPSLIMLYPFDEMTISFEKLAGYNINEVISQEKMAELRELMVPKVVFLRATSALPDEGDSYRYSVDMAFDSDPSTAWNEGSDGSGVGEELRIRFDREVEINGIEAMAGYFDERWFSSNNRVKRLDVELLDDSGGAFQHSMSLLDAMEPQRSAFKPISAREVRFIVKDVYKGSRWNDLAIAELSFFKGEQNIKFSIPETTRPVVGSPSIHDMAPLNQRIVYVSEADGAPDIFVMNADGTDPRKLTLNTAQDVQPRWSSAGARIVFASDRLGEGNWQIYTMTLNGSDVLRMTDDDGMYVAPAWSPDGKAIAYIRIRDYSNVDLVVANADRPASIIAEKREVFRSPGGIGYRWLMYSSEFAGRLIDGLEVRWQGNIISFESWDVMAAADYVLTPSIHVYTYENGRLSGPKPAPESNDMTSAAYFSEQIPGTQLFVNASSRIDNMLGHRAANRDLYIYDTRDTGKSYALTVHTSLDGDPAPSPDGKSVVFASKRDGDLELYRIALDGSWIMQLTDNEGPDYTPIVIEYNN